MSFNFFLSLLDDILHLSLYVVMTLRNLNESKFILFSLIKPSLNFISQFASSLLDKVSQSLNLQSMISVAILQLVSQTLKVCLVQLSNLDFVKLDFPLIMFNYFLNFMLKLIVVLFYQL